MIFPGVLQSTRGILPEQLRPVLEADTGHMLQVNPLPSDEHLQEFCGVGLEEIDAIGTFAPCTIFIGSFSRDDVHAAWEELGYVSTNDREIWRYRGSGENGEASETGDELLRLQQRLSLPPGFHGRYRYLTCIDERFIVEAESGQMLQHICQMYPDRAETGSFVSSGSIPASIGHVAALYEGREFVDARRPEPETDPLSALQRENGEALASIEDELGRMPEVQTAFLGITPGTPWREPLDAVDLPDIASTSLVHIQLKDQRDAERYLSVARARFEALVSPYTELPYAEMFSFEGSTSGDIVSIDLAHLRTPRYDILQMAYFDDLAFLTWGPDDRAG